MEAGGKMLTECHFKLNSSMQTSFWWDHWLDNLVLAVDFCSIFKISSFKDGMVRDFISESGTGPSWNFSFTRNLKEDEIPILATFLHKIGTPPPLSLEEDAISWPHNQNGLSVKSVYDFLSSPLHHNSYPSTFIWKSHMPLKICFFM
ncbi:hypothetical protein BVC80_8389g4 [Macleaya cordata]|uniref:Reverse transcriptase zinc-binding domain n=1 Tax=Macleaya cordata TaxID=56857 RepID=A0A200R389_MACCD|nr:hypothetical protein BVC80_8389g4 [Macleaya cordata]